MRVFVAGGTGAIGRYLIPGTGEPAWTARRERTERVSRRQGLVPVDVGGPSLPSSPPGVTSRSPREAPKGR